MNYKYEAHYSKTGNAECKGCFKKIDQQNILRMVAFPKARRFDGNLRKFYHPECFFNKFSPRSEADINGFGWLRNEDKDLIRQSINSKKLTRKNARKREFDPSENEQENQPPEKQLKADDSNRSMEAIQNEKYHELRDKIKRINQSWIESILRENGQAIPKNKDLVLNHVTDIVLFGVLEPCDENNCRGKLVFDGNSTYRCNSVISGHGLCDKTKKYPQRRRVTIPQILRDEYPFLNIEIDPIGRIVPDAPESPKRPTRKSKSKSKETIDQPSSSQMVLKNDGVVDPGSGLQNNFHVYSEDGNFFSEVLNHVNLHPRRDKNSFYKLQLLESDDQNPRMYYVFQSWGRINTKRGDYKNTPFTGLQAAKDLFSDIYKKKTGNEFGSLFKKDYGKYDKLQITYNEAKNAYKMAKSATLPESIQKLLRLIIDKSIMNDLLVKFNLDLNKMPLGKIEKNSMIKAYNILRDIDSMIKNSTRKAKFIEASNRFYSLIPHNVNCEDVIDTLDLWNKKVDLIAILLETKFTYDFIHKYSGMSANILDVFYGKLNCQIEPLQNSEERRIIEQYVNDTQMNRNLEIREIYEIDRKGEEFRYAKYKNLSNRKLLWHGSRITHFASILANGVKIAPPEAIVIGCMFGKGLYFTDVIAKAVKYCYPNQTNNNGLILLCEVALGDSVLCTDSENIEELPTDKHSVHGVGKISTNSHILLKDVIVPTGKPVEHPEVNTPLNFNEYVVYDNEQVKIKYLVWFKVSSSERPEVDYNI